MFSPRRAGVTLSRPAVFGRLIEQSVHDPHSARERFDPDFVVGLQCALCGRLGSAPRRHVSEAIREHVARHHKATDAGVAVRVLYPRQ